jgi:hypothetical protein
MGMVFIYFGGCTVFLIIYYFFQTKNRDFAIQMIILNMLFLSVSFVILKYFLLENCILFTRFLAFTLEAGTSKIVLNISIAGTYTPYPEGQYRVLLNLAGFQEQLGFLCRDGDNFSINLVAALLWLSVTLEKIAPFLEITLYIYN